MDSSKRLPKILLQDARFVVFSRFGANLGNSVGGSAIFWFGILGSRYFSTGIDPKIILVCAARKIVLLLIFSKYFFYCRQIIDHPTLDSKTI